MSLLIDSAVTYSYVWKRGQRSFRLANGRIAAYAWDGDCTFLLANLRSYLLSARSKVSRPVPARSPTLLPKPIFFLSFSSIFSMFRIIKCKYDGVDVYFENFLLNVNNGAEKAFNSFERIVILRRYARLLEIDFTDHLLKQLTSLTTL